MNKEYVNEDELAKKIAFERTISFVNKLYPKENPEVALKPGQLTSQLQYGFESLFESFRSAIEQVLSADYNNELTTQKSYEIVKKYNQMSSYLKNIAAMNQLSPDDEEKIKKKFDELRGKLESLKTVAKNNNFIDKEDIIDMVDTINETTKIKKDQYKDVSAKSPEMVENIKDKEKATKEYDYITEKLAELNDTLMDPDVNRYSDFQQLKDNVELLEQTFTNTTYDLISPNDRKKINDLYEKVKETYDRANIIKSTITAESSEIQDTVNTTIPQIEANIEEELLATLSNANIKQEIKQYCDANFKADKAAITEDLNTNWPKPNLKLIPADPKLPTPPAVYTTNGATKPAPLKPRSSGKKQDKYEAEMKAYTEDQENIQKYTDEKDAYDDAKKNLRSR